MALDSKIVLVALPSAAGTETLLRPVARLVGCVLELADEDFSLGEMQQDKVMPDLINRVA